ncbi:hypothetical protein CDS [Salmonella enterica subsp. enterica serovar Derby]|nr:hypothetical protein CDS [Salmonella enterica subsp. enterica serovar Derby]
MNALSGLQVRYRCRPDKALASPSGILLFTLQSGIFCLTALHQ